MCSNLEKQHIKLSLLLCFLVPVCIAQGPVSVIEVYWCQFALIRTWCVWSRHLLMPAFLLCLGPSVSLTHNGLCWCLCVLTRFQWLYCKQLLLLLPEAAFGLGPCAVSRSMGGLKFEGSADCRCKGVRIWSINSFFILYVRPVFCFTELIPVTVADWSSASSEAECEKVSERLAIFRVCENSHKFHLGV